MTNNEFNKKMKEVFSKWINTLEVESVAFFDKQNANFYLKYNKNDYYVPITGLIDKDVLEEDNFDFVSAFGDIYKNSFDPNTKTTFFFIKDIVELIDYVPMPGKILKIKDAPGKNEILNTNDYNTIGELAEDLSYSKFDLKKQSKNKEFKITKKPKMQMLAKNFEAMIEDKTYEKRLMVIKDEIDKALDEERIEDFYRLAIEYKELSLEA